MSKKSERLKILAARVEKYQLKTDSALGEIASIISDVSGEDVHCTYFPNDGIGVAVGDSSNHSSLEDIIKELKKTGNISGSLDFTFF